MQKKRISLTDIEAMSRLYRINLINAISGYKSANLIGTQNNQGQTNLAVFSSVTHYGSNPPILGIVFRPISTPRHTYMNIKETGYFTINHIHSNLIDIAHQSSAKYAPDISEFDTLEVETRYSKNCPAPYVKNANIQMGMKYLEEYHIKANNTVLVLGQLEELWLYDKYIHEDGWIDLNAADSATISGLDTYHLPQQLKRYAYARPNQALKELDTTKSVVE